MVSAFWLSKTRPRRCSGSARFCLMCVCLRVQLFASSFLDRFRAEFICNFVKRALKKWVLQPVSVGEAGHFRCHFRLASVVAQFQVTDPAQLLHCVDLSGGRVEGVTLGAFSGDKIAVPHPACLGRCTLLKWRLWHHPSPRPVW